MHFLNLPTSLLSTSFFLLAATGIPVSSTELTADSFDQTVGKGLWLIEHFSPYCHHCRDFKPTWEQLVVEAKEEIPQVKMGTVDCIMHGDLCDKNGIEGYPSILMFEDGKVVDNFSGPRELSNLKTFMKRHIKEDPKPVPPSPPKPALAKPVQPPKVVLNPTGEVLALSGETFSKTLSKGPAFVKFFAPWCGHCKKLAPTWKQLARHMQNKLTVAEVNCDDNSALCKSQGIQGYPTLVWFGKGEDGPGRSEYNGGRKLDQLKAFAEKASAAGVQVLEKDEDLEKHVASDDVLYLLLHSSDDSHILDTIRDASAPLLGSPQIFASSSSALRSFFSIPASSPWALVVIKDHDTKLPVSIFHDTPSLSASDPELHKWLLMHRLPTSVELTRDTFQSVMNAPHAPLVVITAGPEALKEKIMQRLRDVGKKWRSRTNGSGMVHGREVVFAWMDRGRWADWMKSMYGIKEVNDADHDNDKDELEDLKVVIADHSKLIYYDADRFGKSIKFTLSASIFSAVEDAAAGKSTYKNSESTIGRIARNLNAKMQSLEAFVTAYPFQSVLLLLAVFVAVFWMLTRIVGNDVTAVQQGHNEWREFKGKNGRLD